MEDVAHFATPEVPEAIARRAGEQTARVDGGTDLRCGRPRSQQREEQTGTDWPRANEMSVHVSAVPVGSVNAHTAVAGAGIAALACAHERFGSALPRSVSDSARAAGSGRRRNRARQMLPRRIAPVGQLRSQAMSRVHS
jgi:hypothetical protein